MCQPNSRSIGHNLVIAHGGFTDAPTRLGKRQSQDHGGPALRSNVPTAGEPVDLDAHPATEGAEGRLDWPWLALSLTGPELDWPTGRRFLAIWRPLSPHVGMSARNSPGLAAASTIPSNQPRAGRIGLARRRQGGG